MHFIATILALAATAVALPQGGPILLFTISHCDKACQTGEVCAVLVGGPTCIAEKTCNGIMGPKPCGTGEICATWKYDASEGVLNDPPSQCVPTTQVIQ